MSSSGEDYYCYSCERFVRLREGTFLCANCGTGFVQELSSLQQPRGDVFVMSSSPLLPALPAAAGGPLATSSSTDPRQVTRIHQERRTGPGYVSVTSTTEGPGGLQISSAWWSTTTNSTESTTGQRSIEGEGHPTPDSDDPGMVGGHPMADSDGPPSEGGRAIATGTASCSNSSSRPFSNSHFSRAAPEATRGGPEIGASPDASSPDGGFPEGLGGFSFDSIGTGGRVGEHGCVFGAHGPSSRPVDTTPHRRFLDLFLSNLTVPGSPGQPFSFSFPASNHQQPSVGFHGTFGNFALGNLDEIVTHLLNQFEGVDSPVDPRRLSHIPMVTVDAAQVDAGTTCTTCMETFKKGEKVAKLNCDHIFHRDCILPWLQRRNTCPICRQVVDPSGWASPDDPLEKLD